MQAYRNNVLPWSLPIGKQDAKVYTPNEDKKAMKDYKTAHEKWGKFKAVCMFLLPDGKNCILTEKACNFVNCPYRQNFTIGSLWLLVGTIGATLIGASGFSLQEIVITGRYYVIARSTIILE